MQMCIDFEKQGYRITGNGDVAVIVGQKGRLVIPYGDIYTIKCSDLRKRVYELKRFYEPEDRNGRSRRGFRREVPQNLDGRPAAGGEAPDQGVGEPVEGPRQSTIRS